VGRGQKPRELAEAWRALRAIADFDWANAITRIDDRLDYGEMRRLAYGRIGEQNYAVVFVIRGERLRIISLRLMHAKEMRKHEH
jgi:uncharacterized protein